MEYPILHSNNMPSCLDTQAYYTCSNKFMVSTEDNSDFKNTCENECPMECDRIDFEYTSSGNEVNLCKLVYKFCLVYNFFFLIIF